MKKTFSIYTGVEFTEAARELPAVAHCRISSQVPDYPASVKSENDVRGESKSNIMSEMT